MRAVKPATVEDPMPNRCLPLIASLALLLTIALAGGSPRAAATSEGPPAKDVVLASDQPASAMPAGVQPL